MTRPLLEQIARLEREIERTNTDLDREIRDADKDGTRTPEEQREIDQINKQLVEADRVLKALKNEFLNDQNDWRLLAEAVSELRGKFSGMEEFGIEVASIRRAVEHSENLAADNFFREAVDAFNEAQSSASDPIAEYERQSEAKTKYDNDRPPIETALAGFQTANVTSDALTSAISQIETNLTSASGAAEVHDYVEALSLLSLGNPELARAETEVTRLQEEKTRAETELQAVTDKMVSMQSDVSDFDELVQRLDVVATGATEAQAMIEISDFGTVFGHMGSMDYELDAIQSTIPILRAETEAEAARVEAERQLWDSAQPRWSELQDQVRELTEWEDSSASQLGNLATTVQNHVDAEEFQQAVDALGQAEQAAVEPWQHHQAQLAAQTTYNSVRPGLDDRYGAATTHPHVDDAATQQLSQVESLLTRMSDLAGGKDYVAANDETQGVVAGIEAVEQTLRENHARAEAAEALGVDSNTSSADVEDEANRRLYSEERGLLQGRIDDAYANEITGAEVAGALQQIDTDMTSVQATADGGDHGQALRELRDIESEMGRVEELIRDKAELKAQFDAALAELRDDANRGAQSELMTVSESAGHILNSIPEAQAKADDGLYEEALLQVRALQAELADAARKGVKLAAQKTEVESKLSALRPRLDAAAANEYPEIQPTADGVLGKEAEIKGLVEREEFGPALEKLPALVENLEMFETEAESQHGYERYQDAMATLNLEAKLMDMRASIYPETEEKKSAVEEADSTRVGHENSGEWAEARTAAFDESAKLGAFSTEEARIASAKASYDSEAPALIAAAEEVSTEGQEDTTGIIAHWETTLVGIRARMETAATDNRWLEANEILKEFRTTLKEAEVAVRDLFQATDSQIDDFVRTKATLVKVAMVAAMMDGVSRFEVWVLARVEAERKSGKVTRYIGYGIDAVGAVGELDPTGITGAITGGLKLLVDIYADETDNREDDDDNAVGRQLANDLREKMAGLESKLNDNLGPWIKSNNLDAYKEIGNRLYHNDPSAATAVLEGIGVKVEGSMTGVSDAVLSEVTSKFQVIRE